MSIRSESRIRDIPFTHAHSDSFGNHYITQDESLPTAKQFDVTVFPTGDNHKSPDSALRTTPHVRIRKLVDGIWVDLTFTPIDK